MINQWDLWFADFPFEEANQSKASIARISKKPLIYQKISLEKR